MNFNKTLDNESYHSLKSLSSSQIKVAYKNIELFNRSYNNKDKHKPKKSSNAFKMGNMFHELVLEPHLFNPIVMPPRFTDKRTKEYKDWFKTLSQKEQARLITTKENDVLMTMKRNLDRYQEAQELFEGTVNEGSLIYNKSIMGFDWDLRVRPDAFNPKTNHIIDLKTTSKPVDYRTIMREVNDYCYDLSAYMYTNAMSMYTEKPVAFSWVFCQTIEPYSTVVFHMGSELFNYGKRKFYVGFENIVRLRETKDSRYQTGSEILGNNETESLFFVD